MTVVIHRGRELQLALSAISRSTSISNIMNSTVALRIVNPRYQISLGLVEVINNGME